MKPALLRLVCVLGGCLPCLLLAQISPGQPFRTIVPTLPFLVLDQNPAASGTGEILTVGRPEQASTFIWGNHSLLSQGDQEIGGYLHGDRMWNLQGLPTIGDIQVLQGGGWVRLGQRHGLGLGFRSLTIFMPGTPPRIRQEEFILGLDRYLQLGYGGQINRYFSLGMGLKGLNWARRSNNLPRQEQNQIAWAADFSFTGHSPADSDSPWFWQGAFLIQNLGPRIEQAPDLRGFLPGRIMLGGMGGYRWGNLSIDGRYQMQKFLVPSDGSFAPVGYWDGIWGSFSDAPGGLRGEMEELTHQFGVELRYTEDNWLVAYRQGLFLESEPLGSRRFASFGASLGYRGLQLDWAFMLWQPWAWPGLEGLEVYSMRYGIQYRHDL